MTTEGRSSKHRAHLEFRARFSAESSPSDAELELINAVKGPMEGRVLVARTRDNCIIRGCDAISSRELRGYMAGIYVPEPSLREIATLAPGKPMQCNHDTYSAGGMPIARTYKAGMAIDERQDPCVRMGYFMVRTPRTEEFDESVVGGIISEVSASFGYTKLECSICQGDMYDYEDGCAHIPGETYDGRRAVGAVIGVDEYDETSFVWMGAAEGTRMRIAAGARSFDDVARMIEAKRQKATKGVELNVLERLARGRDAASRDRQARFEQLFRRTA